MDINATSLCEPSNSTYYNITFDYIHPEGTLVTTYTQLFQSLQSQVLTNMLYGNIGFLILVIAVLEITRKQECSWEDIINKRATQAQINIKILRGIAMVCFPIALFSVLLLISVKYNLNW